MQFDDIWVQLLSVSNDLALGLTKEPRDAATDVMRAKGLISDLHNVTRLDESLSREQTVVVNMTHGNTPLG